MCEKKKKENMIFIFNSAKREFTIEMMSLLNKGESERKGELLVL